MENGPAGAESEVDRSVPTYSGLIYADAVNKLR